MATTVTTSPLTLAAVKAILDVTPYKYLIINDLLINDAKEIQKYYKDLKIMPHDYLESNQWYMDDSAPEIEWTQIGKFTRIPYYDIP